MQVPTIDISVKIAEDRLNKLYAGSPVEMISLIPDQSVHCVIASQLWLGSLAPLAGYQLIEQFSRVLVADGVVVAYEMAGCQDPFTANAWSFCQSQFKLSGWESVGLSWGDHLLVVFSQRISAFLLPQGISRSRFDELLLSTFCPEQGVVLATDCDQMLIEQSKKAGRWIIGFSGGGES